MLRFSTFRVFLAIVIAFTASASLSLSAFLVDSFQHLGVGWLIVAIEALSVLRCAWSMGRKTIVLASQSVASEVVGLFILSPFQLMIIWVIPSSSPAIGTNTRIFTALQGLAITSAGLHLGYAVGLIVICTLTINAYDEDVWLRDIDSAPSPFPLDILFAFVFPFLARRFSATESLVPQRRTSEYVNATACPPDCGCQGGPRACLKETVPEPGSWVPGERRRPPISARNLVRIPNAAERRATIIVELPVTLVHVT